MALKIKDGVRRENWKGKFRVVARDHGKILSWAKWTRKFSLERAKSIFKLNGSFNPDIKRIRLNKFYEVTDYRIKTIDDKIRDNTRKSASYGQYQYVISVSHKGKTISSRSSQFPNSTNARVAREEALDNIYMALSTEILGETDKDEGKKIFDKITNIREGIIYYAKT